MIALAPRPFHDELLSSTWSRMATRTRLPISRLTFIVLGCKWTPGVFQPGHIEQTAGMLRMSPIDLVLRHTVFGYSTAYMAQHSYDAALKFALSIGVDARKVGAITQSVSDHTQFRRYCMRCATEDLANVGVSYWRRAHNLPGVFICLKHRATLFEDTSLSTRGRTTWTQVQPHESNGKQIEIASAKRRHFLTKFAELSIAAMRPRTQGAPGSSARGYRQELIRRELLSTGRPIDCEALVRLVRRKMAGPLPTPLAMTCKDSDDLSWLPLMLRPGSRLTFVPLKHLVLQTAIELSDDEGRFSLDFRPEGCRANDRDRVDAESSIMLRMAVDQALDRAQKLSVTQTLKDLGCWQLYRHNSRLLPLLSAEVLRLRLSDASLRKTTRRKLIRIARRRQGKKT